MRKLSCVLCVVLFAWPAFAQNGSGVTTNSTQRVTIATDDSSVSSLLSIVSNTDTISSTLTTISGQLTADATHDSPSIATGPQTMLEYKVLDGTLSNAVSTENDAVRAAGGIGGIAYVLPVDAAGTDSPIALEDAAGLFDGKALMKIACMRDDTLGATSGTEGDVEPCHTNANGALWSIDVNSASALTSLQLIDNLVTDPCAGTAQTLVPFSFSTATTTQLIAASGSNKNYICSINIVVGGADNVALVEDDTSACASPTAGMAGGTTAATGWNFGANGGLAFGNGKGTVFKSAATNVYTCLISSAAQQVSGSISYVQAP